ncbi:kinase-like domain-containing protein [Penicillium psychrosexuale]|uniref:kinase-like domain-containing protein n=1 Tax=Penicillium psychrosexuale TaxID=1002107 RepID=UPI002545A922|nr:kinase-like domain-containing protein [Penicillium psychrosexuale]KAJ5791433.1 kinase-like domain-containing protein [Penicillium psychrosexuale]
MISVLIIAQAHLLSAAPVEFSSAPPWWLLIEKPEYWPKGLDDWCRDFLTAMIHCEDEAIKHGWLKEDQRLSDPMQNT